MMMIGSTNSFPLAPFLASLSVDGIRVTLNDARAVERRKDEYQNLSPDFLKLAIARFLGLRNRNLRKGPSTAELLVWLRVLSTATGTGPEPLLDADLSKLPYLEALLKDHMDLEELSGKG